MEPWRKTFRDGIVPQLSTPVLEAVAKALEMDSPLIIQGAATTPPPLQCVQDFPVEAACFLGFCAAIDKGGFYPDRDAATVGEAEEGFARMCFECDQRLGEPASCRWFLTWFDEENRVHVFWHLLQEIKRTLANRRIGQLSNGAIDVDVASIEGVDK